MMIVFQTPRRTESECTTVTTKERNDHGDYDDDSLKLKVKLHRHSVMINTMSLPHIGIQVRVSGIQLIKRC